MKPGDHMIANHESYWGSYHGTTVILLEQIGAETWNVEAYDGKTYSAHEKMLADTASFYKDQFNWDDPPNTCICDSFVVFNKGCQCKYGKKELESERTRV